MNEEEKKAIAYLKFYLSDSENEYFDKDFVISKKDLRIILNLIEKQQAEIEEYKTLLKRQKELEKEEETLKKQGWLDE